MALFRRPGLPDDVRDRLVLQRGERMLAAAPLTQGWAVATNHHLHVVADEVQRRPWTDVSGARLEPESAVLTVIWVDGAAETDLDLAGDPGPEFPAVVRQCIDSSIVHSEQVSLPRRRHVVRVVLRRDAEDRLFTQVIGRGDVDLADPETAAVIDAAEARVREAAGLL